MVEVLNSLRYSLYVIFHPFDGFWDLKHEKRGSISSALTIVFLLTATYVVKRQLTGFRFNMVDLTKLNIITELMRVLIPFAMWCISNWCLTTLMDGEGTFNDIVIATAYALVPMIIIYIPMTFASNFMTIEEGLFYVFFNTLAVIWSGFLFFVATMTIHQYTPRKTIFTMLLIVVGMGIITFIALLFFNLIQEIVSFAYTIWRELNLRN